MFSYEKKITTQPLKTKAPETPPRRSAPAMAIRFPEKTFPGAVASVIQREPDGEEEDEIPPDSEIEFVGMVESYHVGRNGGNYYLKTPGDRTFRCTLMEDDFLFFSCDGLFIMINISTRKFSEASYYNLENWMVVFQAETGSLIVNWSAKNIYYSVISGSVVCLFATKDETQMLMYQTDGNRFFFSQEPLAAVRDSYLVLFQHENEFVFVCQGGKISDVFTMEENGAYSSGVVNDKEILIDHEFGEIYIREDEIPLLRRTRKHDCVCHVYHAAWMIQSGEEIYEGMVIVDPTVQKLYRYAGITFRRNKKEECSSEPLCVWFASDTETIQVAHDLSQATEDRSCDEILRFQEPQDALSGFVYDMLNQQWEYTGADAPAIETPSPFAVDLEGRPLEDGPFELLAGKLSTNLTAVVMAAPVVPLQGDRPVYAEDMRIVDIMLGNGDRPPTQFETQRSHTVAWTLLRAGIEALNGKPVIQFLMMMREKFLELLYFVEQTEGRILLDSVMKLKEYIPGKELLLNAASAVKAPETVMTEEKIVLRQLLGSAEENQEGALERNGAEDIIETVTPGQEAVETKREIRFEYDTIGALIRTPLPAAVWNEICSRLLVSYLQVYQLSQAAVYNKKPAGRGEGSAMLKLHEWEDRFLQIGTIPLSAEEILEIQNKMEALLDVEFRINMLGVWEYAFAVSEWITMLRQVFPTLMQSGEEYFIGHFLGKQLAKSFYTSEPEQARGQVPKFLWAQKQPPTVRDLMEAYEAKRTEFQTAAALPQPLAEPQPQPLAGPLPAAYVPDVAWNEPEGYLLSTNFVSRIFLQPIEPAKGLEESSGMEQLFVSSVRISDRDRARTKFLKVQGSHTVAWTLTREALLAFQGKRLQLLVFFLEKSLKSLAEEPPEGRVRKAFKWELARGNFYIQKLKEGRKPMFMMMQYAGDAVRSYVIVSQAAACASYYNPQEPTPLGHGEGKRMELLRENESALDLSNLAHTFHTEQKIIETVLGLFDAKVTDQFPLDMVMRAHYDFMRKLIIAFPNIMKVFGPNIAAANLAFINEGWSGGEEK